MLITDNSHLHGSNSSCDTSKGRAEVLGPGARHLPVLEHSYGARLCLTIASPPQEKQELEEQRVALMEEVQSYRNRIRQLEDDLLFRLSNSQVVESPCISQSWSGHHQACCSTGLIFALSMSHLPDFDTCCKTCTRSSDICEGTCGKSASL